MVVAVHGQMMECGQEDTGGACFELALSVRWVGFYFIGRAGAGQAHEMKKREEVV
jgi:hypothetical protein